MFDGLPLSSLLVWSPIVGGLATLVAGGANGDDKHASQRGLLPKSIALVAATAVFALCVLLYAMFDKTAAAMQFVERVAWIESFNIHYHLGIDGISMPLIVLTGFITPLVVIAGWRVVKTHVAQYMAAFLIMEGLIIGVFSSLDAVLFYVFWEAMLIPMFIIIGVWGGRNRVYATIKFFLYTFLGSVLMLVALIYMRYQTATGSFAILDFHNLPLDITQQTWIFLAFLLAFAVKVPMWPVHTWLPDAHVEAPTGGSVILAAITLKLGGYGFLRFSLPITPDASMALSWLVIALSLVAIVYIGFVAMAQEDMKKLVAYSSIAHMGFATLGFFLPFSILAARQGDITAAVLSVQGGMAQMVSHGFISAALFFCIGVMYDRMRSRRIADYGGVAVSMPVFAAFMVLFAMANAGLPGTSGFVGEFMVILAAMKSNFLVAFLAAVTMVLGAAYSLWLVKRVVFGAVKNDNVAAMPDLNGREFAVLSVLAAAVLLLGVWPLPLIEAMHPAIDQLLRHIAVSKLQGG